MAIERVAASYYEVPLDAPESDGTIVWTKTTVVVVEIEQDGERGTGYSYAPRAAATLIRDELASRVVERDARAVRGIHADLARALRNAGRDGVGSMAISAIDVALWDLSAKLARLPLAQLLGLARSEVPIYGSGGFTSLSIGQLEEQLSGWQSQGFSRVKMKIGREPAFDVERVRRARAAVGRDCELMVDANGAFTPKQALRFLDEIANVDIVYIEEPVSSDDIAGLRFVREHTGVDVAAGEYAWSARDSRRLLEAGAVDIVQADATRCGGITGLLQAAALADAFEVPLSSHCAPSIHAHAACAAPRFAHLEYFADHARAERLLFEGVLDPVGGALRFDPSRAGLGIALKSDAQRYRKD
jgi:L-alanine-DL-glutamate epimerase-like enolase superfamily enzyme